MIIGIDIRVLATEVKSGIEEYTENLLAHMLPLDNSIKFKLFFSSSKNNLKKYDWMELPNVEVFNFNLPNKLLFVFSRLFNWPQIDKLVGGADVFFSPHFLLSSLSSNCKRVTTVHDLSYVRFKEFFSWRRNVWHKFQVYNLSKHNFSDKVIAVSDSTKKDLIETYGISSSKIKTIYSGVSEFMKRVEQKELEFFKLQNNFPEKFILFLGKLEPRKNIIGLIRAFNFLKQTKGFENLHLVIIGSRGWLYKSIYQEVYRSKFKDQIIFKNHIKDVERKFYYSLASVFVYPSFFEGFGFPPLEAMACGTPVIASLNSSLPEVVGEASILIDPYNAVDISNAIKIVLTDLKLKDLLKDKGLKVANNFSWNRCAEETLKVLKDTK